MERFQPSLIVARLTSVMCVAMLGACGTMDSAYRATRSGIAGLNPGMEAWHGHSFDELRDSWGEPSTQLALGDDVVAYTWISPDSDCQRTFTVRDNRIVGSSDTNCVE